MNHSDEGSQISAKGNKINDEGFTLLELLVVVVIIGILNAIAIPIFLSYRTSAVRQAHAVEARQLMIEEINAELNGTANIPATVDGQTVATDNSVINPPVGSLLRPCPSGKVVGQVGKQKCVVTGGKNFYIDPKNDK